MYYQNNPNYYFDPNQYWGAYYAEQLLAADGMRSSDPVRQGGVDEILRIFLIRRQDILELIEAFGVPRRVSLITTRRIISFVIDNADKVTGTFPERVNQLYRRFTREDQWVYLILRLYRVPDNVIDRYVRSVIRVTLRNIGVGPGPTIEEEVARLTLEFEERFPNFLGLTSIYRIPRRVARDIVSDIIRFTLRNIRRISPYGSVPQRAEEMLRLLDREQPELIRAMIRRGVPAGQAEDITRRIIIFTLRNADI